jgi:hypothetical protein
MQNFSDTVALFTYSEKNPGFGLTLFRDPTPSPHQWFDVTSVFTSQPVRQFPEHYSIYALEDARCVVSVLVEGSPSSKLAVEVFNHIDLAEIVITREGIGQFMCKRLGLLFGYRRHN